MLHSPLLLALSLAGCGGPERPGDPTDAPDVVTAPPAWTGPDLSTTGARALVLDRMQPELDLPEHNRAHDEGARTTWRYPAPAAEGGWVRISLPFRVARAERRIRPEGMEVLVDGYPAEFTVQRRQRAVPVWRITHARSPLHEDAPAATLEIGALGPVGEVVIKHPRLLDDLARLTWRDARASGLSAEAFARHQVTLGKETRDGLLLPAPATATWRDVTLPPDARFEAWLTLAPTPVPHSSDGAELALVLVREGEEVELGRYALPPATSTFRRWTLDLSSHAGARGDLVLRTLPGSAGDAVDDYVFVGSPTITSPPVGDVRRVVVIALDTLRPDHLGLFGYPRDTSPEIDAWAQDAVTFEQAWTTAPRTRPSFRASTTGRLPLDAVCARNVGDVFDEAGFATAGIVANVHLNPRFDFHRGFDWWRLDTGAKADEQVDLAMRWLDEHRHRDAYLFLHIMDPHIFYVAPPPFGERFTSELPPLSDDEHLPRHFNRSVIYQMMNRGQLSELQKQHIVARYDGEVAWTSFQLGRLFEHLDQLPGRTAVVLHSDHGEEFWEHGGFEHNHTLYDDTTRGLLVIKPPGGAAGRSRMPATLQDIGPTLYELAGIPAPPHADGVSLVPALRGAPADPERPIPLGYLQYDAERWGVVWRDHKYIVFTGTGREELYDLAADPAERYDLSGKVDTSPWWRKTAEAHAQGLDIGPGWRVQVDLPPGADVTLSLPADALSAGVLDPESVTRHPVNQEWGEVPKILPEDVGTVELVDARTVRLRAGQQGKGILYVRFADDVPAGGTVTGDGPPVSLARADVTVSGGRLVVRPGVVVVPPRSEFQRMADCAADEGTDEELEELAALGYLHDEQAHPDEPSASDDAPAE